MCYDPSSSLLTKGCLPVEQKRGKSLHGTWMWTVLWHNFEKKKLIDLAIFCASAKIFKKKKDSLANDYHIVGACTNGL